MRVYRIPRTADLRKRRAAVYCRVSTSREVQEESLDVQAAALRRMIADREDWTFAGIYADDGRSGTGVDGRPEFQRLLRDAAAGKLDLVLVKSISRFSRNIIDCQRCARALRDMGVELYFEREGLSTVSSSGELLFALLGVIAQDESRAISENVKWTYRENFARGHYRLGNNRMLGYDMDAQGRLTSNGDAWIVRRIFECFIAGMGCRQIADDLNAVGARRLRSERPWSASAIQSILSNEVYAGDRRLQKRVPVDLLTGQPDPAESYCSRLLTDVHEAIVDRDSWNRAREILDRRREEAAQGVFHRGGKQHYLYGKLFCGLCGAPCIRRTWQSGARSAWVCRNRRKRAHAVPCANAILSEETLLERISTALAWPWKDSGHFDAASFDVLVERIEIHGEEDIRIQLRQ